MQNNRYQVAQDDQPHSIMVRVSIFALPTLQIKQEEKSYREKNNRSVTERTKRPMKRKEQCERLKVINLQIHPPEPSHVLGIHEIRMEVIVHAGV